MEEKSRGRLNVLEGEDRARFEAIVLPHLDAAFNLARWLLRSRSDAEAGAVARGESLGAAGDPGGPGAGRSQSGKRPAAALAASTAARATTMIALTVPTQDRDLCNGLPLPRAAAGAGPSRRFVMVTPPARPAHPLP